MADTEKELRIKATASTAEAKAAVDDLNASVKAVAPAQDGATASELKGVEGLKALQEQMRAAASGARGVGAATASAAEGAGLLTRAITALSGTKGNLILILVTLLLHLKEVNEWFARVMDRAVAWFTAAGQGTKVLDEHGKVVDALDPKYVKLATAQDLHVRALAAQDKGLISATENTKQLDAAETIREAALHKTVGITKEYGEALKALGIRAVESFTSIQVSAQAFSREYQRILETDGVAAARIFAQENSALLDKVETRYIKLGLEVPKGLKVIADSIGLVSKAESDLAKNTELEKKYEATVANLKGKMEDLSKSLDENGKAFVKHSQSIEADRLKANEAIADTTNKTIAGLQAQVREGPDGLRLAEHLRLRIQHADQFALRRAGEGEVGRVRGRARGGREGEG